MINEAVLPKAYKEVIEILKYVPEIDYNKIPKYLIEKFEKDAEKDYNYNVTEFEDFDKQPMLKETKAILAVIFRDYWATEEQREIIRSNEKFDIRKNEEAKRNEYNPDDIFAKRREKDNIEEKIDNNNSLVIVEETSILKKILKKIKKFFHIK
mgnify:FL=1